MAGAALAAGAALWFVDPSTRGIPLCPLHAMTGLWCPFCGSTRASHALIHAELANALRYNALFVAALPLLAPLWWRRLRSPDPRPAARPLPRPVFWAGIALVLAFGVVRNLGVGRWLAPPS
ncbi:DUF2752 domain-containing protein [Jatrophihabitans sp.]|uniref:DUF2752 domain-containing protein n=1 Tax=Jatrophihabitans sp. TaxID=1932789 RepID=UPI0038CD6B71